MQTQRENFADPADINAILDMRRIAVVGLSSDPWRPSHGVAAHLQREGYEITPVNPNETEVLGKRAYANDVRTRRFPSEDESYHLNGEVAEALGLYGAATKSA